MIPAYWWSRASFYIGIVVVVCAIVSKKAAECLFPLTLSVSLYGTLETILQGDSMGTPEKIASIVGHNILPFLCMMHGVPKIRPIWVLFHTIVLSLICTVYLYLGNWPYVIDVPLSVLLVGLIHIIEFMHTTKTV